jgi:hypothetical protein
MVIERRQHLLAGDSGGSYYCNWDFHRNSCVRDYRFSRDINLAFWCAILAEALDVMGFAPDK